MIDRSDVEQRFTRLRSLADTTALDQGSFVVDRIDEIGTRFIAQSADGESALIVATAGSAPIPPLRLAGLSVDYGQDCILVEAGERQQLRASVVRGTSRGRGANDLFATLCASLADRLPSQVTDQDVAIEIDRWARLFWRLSQPATTELIGLAGELVCIAGADDKDQWVKAWHAHPEDRFDFTFLPGKGVVEVKSTSRERRIHEFGLAQVLGPQEGSRLIASVRIVGEGTTLGELVRSICDALYDDASVLAFWNVLTLTCGARLDEAMSSFTFDREIATSTIRYFEASSVPRPVVDLPLPPGVANVRYMADLEFSQEVSPEVVRTVTVNQDAI